MTRHTEPLATVFERLIANYGPISIQHFMDESNARYYADRDPLGAGGDFITAPEISQMFGELIGLWLADMWIRAGRETPVHYVELGPGRGTLARDALRAAARYGLEPGVHFVESSTALKDLQLATVPQAHWHADLSTVPAYGPLLLVGNEFLDALPIRQLVRAGGGWRERMVACEDGRFVAVAGDKPMDAAVPEDLREAPEGTIVETSPAAAAILYEVAGRLAEQGGAALLIDYGHDHPRIGSTLQALREHQKVEALSMPGEADLTAHVDFAALAAIAQARGCTWLGTTTQGRFLRALGIETRAENLATFAPEHREAVFSAMERLIGEGQMGALFKVMGLAGPNWPEGAGF
ncbi:methyltransferase [Novosphingobium sp. PC22D]|uniref:class I SAM-dependent methyltransferase n=1 Tax=Novosphingobium sp. PC22D TaxID=1962403 RepID=UPI000BF183C5|nr:SAM-dependent methyltransferase [Novosphingobium sp. PC22D]PEQ11572.1 methyltransferase [Novosphingobium sp. PC22D]